MELHSIWSEISFVCAHACLQDCFGDRGAYSPSTHSLKAFLTVEFIELFVCSRHKPCFWHKLCKYSRTSWMIKFLTRILWKVVTAFRSTVQTMIHYELIFYKAEHLGWGFKNVPIFLFVCWVFLFLIRHLRMYLCWTSVHRDQRTVSDWLELGLLVLGGT